MKMSVVVIVASLSLVPNFFYSFYVFSSFFTLGWDRHSGVGWGLASFVVWVFRSLFMFHIGASLLGIFMVFWRRERVFFSELGMTEAI